MSVVMVKFGRNPDKGLKIAHLAVKELIHSIPF